MDTKNAGRERPTDLLLLNASNYPRLPLYPYAFVQVAEVARRHGLEVASCDLLGLPEPQLRAHLASLLARRRPRAIGLHLRQLDSLFVEEYRGYLPREGGPPSIADSVEPAGFRPVERTARLVALLRELTDAPILLGGHGLSASPRAVFDRVAPDLAVVGEPDGLFARFEEAIGGGPQARAAIPNLMQRVGGELVFGPRVFYGPAEGAEYTAAIVDDIHRFYGTAALHRQTFPIEVMRGCPYRCTFCCEPAVKGTEARLRPLDAVMADVERLAAHGLRQLWMVCSELNALGPGPALALAERLVRWQEQSGVELRWYAFSLPSRMGLDVWRTLARSGFRGGFNTFFSLDDENLRRGRIPHRAADAIVEYLHIEQVSRELPPGDGIRARGTMALFLGNAYATPATIARTVAALREHDLLEAVPMPWSMAATRLFETLPVDPARAAGEVVSFAAGGDHDDGVDLSLPTFEYAPALVRHFGGRRALERFLRWLDLTVLSRGHEATQDHALFVANSTTPEELAHWLGGRPGDRSEHDAPSLRALFHPDPAERAEASARARALVEEVLAAHPGPVEVALAALGLPGPLDRALALPIFDLLAALYARFDDTAQALAAVADRASEHGDDARRLALLGARFLLHRRNVALHPSWRAPLFDVDRPRAAARRLPLA